MTDVEKLTAIEEIRRIRSGSGGWVANRPAKPLRKPCPNSMWLTSGPRGFSIVDP